MGAGAVRTPRPYAEGDSLGGRFASVSAEVVHVSDVELESTAAGCMYAWLTVLDELDVYAVGWLKVVLAYLTTSGEASASRLHRTSRRTSRTDSMFKSSRTSEVVNISMQKSEDQLQSAATEPKEHNEKSDTSTEKNILIPKELLDREQKDNITRGLSGHVFPHQPIVSTRAASYSVLVESRLGAPPALCEVYRYVAHR